ncbi:MAG TPA: hypothetical protein VEF89_05700 [Solirubrobacteraceae bacterium]|nr:hypothetical protein [Solirubrobacteraceae bacterium]
MLFRHSRRQKLDAGVSPANLPGGDEAGRWRSRQWRVWRRSEQKLLRLWNEWLAADPRDSEHCYRRYLQALADEEHAAAELAQTIEDRGDQRATHTGPQTMRAA